MKKLLAKVLGRNGKAEQATKRRRQACRLSLETLESREVPVVGAFAIPPALAPDNQYDGVVALRIGFKETGPDCTGTLLTTGRHILTAAHCLYDDSGAIVARTQVVFERAGEPVLINLNSSDYTIHQDWNRRVGDGNDLAILTLPVLAPSGPFGTERFDIYRDTNEIGQQFTLVGYGKTGTGDTGERDDLALGPKRLGMNEWTAEANILRNEIQVITPNTIADNVAFRLSFSGRTTAVIPTRASAAQVRTALEGLSNIGVGDVAVQGGPDLGTPWFVSFRNVLGNHNLGQLKVRTLPFPFLQADVSVSTLFDGLPRAKGQALAYDFDNGNQVNDAMGMFYDLNGLGLGANEAMQGDRDSGGPAFIGTRIAGVVSFSRRSPSAHAVPDVDGVGNNSFGEIGVMTRVSAFADWIDNVTRGNPNVLTLDMNYQPRGNDGLPDNIIVTLNNGNLDIEVNGELYHSEPEANVSVFYILGSADGENIKVAPRAGILNPTLVDPRGGSNQLLTISGTSNADTVKVKGPEVTLNGALLYYSNVQILQVSAHEGDDVFTVESVAAGTDVQFLGDEGTDTLIAPHGGSTWTITRVNGGNLDIPVSFQDVENLVGGSGPDTFAFTGDGGVTGTVAGGLGFDTLDYSTSAQPARVDLQFNAATATGGFSGIDNLVGGSESDLLIGPSRDNLWNVTGHNAGTVSNLAKRGRRRPSLSQSFSFSGVENLAGSSYADTFLFGANARLDGTVDGGFGLGTDKLDRLDFGARTTGVVVDLVRGTATDLGGVSNLEHVTGSQGDDLLRGNELANVLRAGGGSDILVGEDGTDDLDGCTGRCVVIGGKGADRITGGGEDDLLIASWTDFDENHFALQAIINEWRRTDRTYAQRVQALRDGVSGDDVFVSLTTTTVHDDEVTDELVGKQGDDWFWAFDEEAARAGLVSIPGTKEFLDEPVDLPQ